jgi:hypothetical protein
MVPVTPGSRGRLPTNVDADALTDALPDAPADARWALAGASG